MIGQKTNEDTRFANEVMSYDGDIIIRNIIVSEMPHYFFDRSNGNTVIYIIIDSNQKLQEFKYYADQCDQQVLNEFLEKLLIKECKLYKSLFDSIIYKNYIKYQCQSIDIRLISEKDIKNVNWHFDNVRYIDFVADFSDIPFLKYVLNMSGYMDITNKDMVKMYEECLHKHHPIQQKQKCKPFIKVLSSRKTEKL